MINRGVTSRRSILAGFATTGVSLLIAACSSAAPSSPTATSATPAPTAAPTSTPGSTSTPAAQAAPAGGASPAASPATGAVAAANQLPRQQTLIFSESDATNQFADVQNMNPYLAGIARSGWQFAFEPLYFYNTYYTDQVCGPPGMPCKDGEIPWQAESYAYSPDYTQLTIKLRGGITWSDGQPFTASDVAFTLNLLKDNAPKLTWSVDMHQWVKVAVALDPLTAKITLNAPNPRFMFDYFMMHYDQGLVMVPEHIFKGQDPTTFTNFDLGKKWPIVTGPWQLVLSSPEQKFWDRRDDWWAAKAGFHPLLAMKRIIDLPSYEDTKRLELLLSNQVDATHNMQPANAIAAIQQNPKLKMWLPSSPYGLIDFTTNGMFFNCAKPPFDDPDIRWAIDHALNRDQVVQVGYHGNGVKATLPLPGFPSMKPYYDAASDVLQKLPIDAYDPNKTAQIMQAKGYAKDQGGFWAKGGRRFPLVILIPPGFFGDITPVIVEQLRKAGFDASFKAISTYSTIEALGQEDAFLTTFGGSVRDPYFNLDYFVSQYSAPTNQPAVQPYRWENRPFDQAVARMGTVAATDPTFMSAYHQAIELWVTALPGIPIVQNFVMIPVNTTYWTNWPDASNPYTIPSNWHRTAGLFINTLRPAG